MAALSAKREIVLPPPIAVRPPLPDVIVRSPELPPILVVADPVVLMFAAPVWVSAPKVLRPLTPRVVSDRPEKVGLDVVAMAWGRERVTAPIAGDAGDVMISSVVPVIEVTPIPERGCQVGRAAAPLLTSTCPEVPAPVFWKLPVLVVPPHKTPKAVVLEIPVPPEATPSGVPIVTVPVRVMPPLPDWIVVAEVVLVLPTVTIFAPAPLAMLTVLPPTPCAILTVVAPAPLPISTLFVPDELPSVRFPVCAVPPIVIVPVVVEEPTV